MEQRRDTQGIDKWDIEAEQRRAATFYVVSKRNEWKNFGATKMPNSNHQIDDDDDKNFASWDVRFMILTLIFEQKQNILLLCVYSLCK